MARGTIAKLVRDRGFGFISQADGTEIFFHRSKVVGSFDTLSEGQKVSYDVLTERGKPAAGNLKAA